MTRHFISRAKVIVTIEEISRLDGSLLIHLSQMSIDRDVSAIRNGPQPAREAAREIMSGNAVRSSGSRYSRFLARCTVVISERIAQLGTNNSTSK